MNVIVTQGGKYHADATCYMLANGEALWRNDSEGWTPGAYRREVDTVELAAMCGKLPCLNCVPADQRAMPPLYRQHFGHEPMDVITNGRLRAVECFRCQIEWPCTSARVLGITDPEPEVLPPPVS